MQQAEYSVEEFARDLRTIAAEETTDADIVARVKPLARRLAAAPGWFREEYRYCDPEQGFGVHLLHEEENHELAVFALAWLPDRGAPESPPPSPSCGHHGPRAPAPGSKRSGFPGHRPLLGSSHRS